METWSSYKKEQKDSGYKKIEVACPYCGAPIYKDLTVVLATYPPQYRYFCKECGWSDTAYN